MNDILVVILVAVGFQGMVHLILNIHKKNEC